jgi:transcriptional/translational regulatory protein YebC/TACO1
MSLGRGVCGGCRCIWVLSKHPCAAKTIIRGAFSDFGKLQAALEAQGVAVQSAESEYVAQHLVTLAEDKATEVLKLLDALEQDEDVQRVFHNLG